MISASRSAPDWWMVLRELDLLARVRLPSRLSRELPRQDQQAVERRAQLVRHVGQELRLVARGERQLLGLLLQLLLGELDLAVLALDLGLLLGQLAGLLLQLLVGLLQLFLLRLQLFGHALRLAQQLVGAHRRLDGGDHDAQALDQLLEEGELDVGEALERRQLEHALDLALEQDRHHHDVAAAPPRRATS